MAKRSNNIVALAGGLGGAKLGYGLAQIVPPEELTIIVNTSADFEHLGLHISPDLDTVMYGLAGVTKAVSGWGLKGESWNMMAAMARYGGPTWFQLGDRELATHLLRSKWLREGYPHTWVTKELGRRLGVRCTLLPMTEAAVSTIIQTETEELALQAYLSQKHGEPVVKGLRFAGIEEAQPSQEVIKAVRNADVIVFCPSNPLLSLDPILTLPNMRRIIVASRVPKIGVSPLVRGEAAQGSTARIMTELGLDVSAVGVANHLKEVLTGFVIDRLDEARQDEITKMGLQTWVTTTTMRNVEGCVSLAKEVLDFALTLAR